MTQYLSQAQRELLQRIHNMQLEIADVELDHGPMVTMTPYLEGQLQELKVYGTKMLSLAADLQGQIAKARQK